MEWKEILSRCDHTLLKPECTWEEIEVLCREAEEFGCASVCIPPCYVKRANELLGERMKVCTVIGFPNGNTTPAVKVFETENAIRHGADEIDMVANIGWIKSGRWDRILEELKMVKASCGGRILKVIIETCLLTEEEKIRMCQLVTEAGADFIKTSTGFSSGGATGEDVKLLREHVGPDVRVKAAGGIASKKDAEELIALGADRLGTSRLVGLARGQGK